MQPDDPRAQQWRQRLNQALNDYPMSRAELARRLGRSAAQVSQWAADGNRYGPPEPDIVFAIEDELGCPGLLAVVLGYERAGLPVTAESVILADPTLLPAQKATLIVQIESSRLAAQDLRSQRRPPPA